MGGETRLTIDEAASRLGVHPNTLRRWVNERKISHVRLGWRIFFRPEHVDAFLANAEQPAVDIDDRPTPAAEPTSAEA